MEDVGSDSDFTIPPGAARFGVHYRFGRKSGSMTLKATLKSPSPNFFLLLRWRRAIRFIAATYTTNSDQNNIQVTVVLLSNSWGATKISRPFFFGGYISNVTGSISPATLRRTRSGASWSVRYAAACRMPGKSNPPAPGSRARKPTRDRRLCRRTTPGTSL